MCPILRIDSSKSFADEIRDFEFTVPDDFSQDTQIDDFCKNKREVNNKLNYPFDFTSNNFKKVSSALLPGKTYRARFIPIKDEDKIVSLDCLRFLKKQKAKLIGAQGLTLIQELEPDEFPMQRFIISFDKEDSLFFDPEYKDSRVPGIYRHANDEVEIFLGYFGRPWDDNYCLLCVTEI